VARGLTDGAWDHSSAVEDGLASAAVDGAIDGGEGAGGASDGGRASGGLGGGERERLSHCSSCCCCNLQIRRWVQIKAAGAAARVTRAAHSHDDAALRGCPLIRDRSCDGFKFQHINAN